MQSTSELYKKELFENVIPFWEKYSIDNEYGGYFSCLSRNGKVFDTDKFMWLQAREIWMFAHLYHRFEPVAAWKKTAIHGADFLEKHGRDAEGNWFFSLDRAGNPLVQPYNIFSDCFAAMAFAALYKIEPEERYKRIAVDTFRNILKRQDHPKGKWEKNIPGGRALRNFSLPMILSNISLEMEALMPPGEVERLIDEVIRQVMEEFYHEGHGLLFENIQKNGELSDTFEGRLINPGHGLEAMWFIMDLGLRKKDSALIEKAVSIALETIAYGWDKEYGGIFYFLDVDGKPCQQLEWDQKLWWVHLEAMVCMIKAYELTGNTKAKEWFDKLHNYCWDRFRDPEYGEWFGYLNRQGLPHLDLKGGKWKGCFHVPRALFCIYNSLVNIEKKKYVSKNIRQAL